jgi:hypothetical protein
MSVNANLEFVREGKFLSDSMTLLSLILIISETLKNGIFCLVIPTSLRSSLRSPQDASVT